MGVKNWIPLESNPDVLNEYAARLGLDTTTYAFADVYGLDEVGRASYPTHCAATRRPPLRPKRRRTRTAVLLLPPYAGAAGHGPPPCHRRGDAVPHHPRHRGRPQAG